MAEKGKNMLLIEPGNPRLLKKPVNDGSEYSLYLEYKVGYKEENGSCIRRIEGLSLRLMANPRTTAQRQKNKETMGAVRYTDDSFWANDGEVPQAITDGRI